MKKEKQGKKKLTLFLGLCLILSLLCPLSVRGEELNLSSPSVMLMESKTGTIIYEKNAKEVRSPASITKIMTLFLIFEALEEGRIHLEDPVITSAYAKSMGGSQVFLEEGEEQTVEVLIKCIAVASGNDASVAMAEHLFGSEAAFVEEMNKKAAQLGLKDTHFMDCTGLSDSDDHYTTAQDVAYLSRELTNRFPKVFQYTTIWMEDITHVTDKGESTFTLSSTNKLLKQYPYANGLKTGSTNKAKYCLAATAKKDDVQLIAVVMGSPDPKIRFQECETLLNYGFAKVNLYEDDEEINFVPLTVERGVKDTVEIGIKTKFTWLDTQGNDLGQIRKEERLPKSVQAPIKKGDQIGEVVYFLGEQKIGQVKIAALESIELATLKDTFQRAFGKWLLGTAKV